jgi:hypothetical protein
VIGNPPDVRPVAREGDTIRRPPGSVRQLLDLDATFGDGRRSSTTQGRLQYLPPRFGAMKRCNRFRHLVAVRHLYRKTLVERQLMMPDRAIPRATAACRKAYCLVPITTDSRRSAERLQSGKAEKRAPI